MKQTIYLTILTLIMISAITIIGGCNEGCSDASDCNDNMRCTTDICDSNSNPAVCVNSPVDCTDTDSCTLDRCDTNNGNCIHTTKACSDANLCTNDSCDPATGNCVYNAMNCSDTNGCTIDNCDATTGNCYYTPKNCSDANLCTNDSCDPATGNCVFNAMNCSDANGCTIDNCDATTGNCYSSPKNCSDTLLCTIDSCTYPTGTCVHTSTFPPPNCCAEPDGAFGEFCPTACCRGCIESNFTCFQSCRQYLNVYKPTKRDERFTEEDCATGWPLRFYCTDNVCYQDVCDPIDPVDALTLKCVKILNLRANCTTQGKTCQNGTKLTNPCSCV